MEPTDYAEYYDYDHDFSFDLDFYRACAAKCQSPILELACGTGRLLIPLAQDGYEITGLDISENMLAVCREKVLAGDLQDRVRLVQGDMSDFDLPVKDFGLAFIALRSFMHLLDQTDQLACLKTVYRHLRPGGGLVVDIIAPDIEKLSQKPDQAYVIRREFDQPNGNRVIRKNRLAWHDPVRQVRRFDFLFEEFDPSGNLVKTREVPVYTRYTFRYEMELLLGLAGFEIANIYRDHEMNPYDGTREMIVVARHP